MRVSRLRVWTARISNRASTRSAASCAISGQATTSSFNALRQDFVDLRRHVDEGFARVDEGFAEMRGKLDGAAAGQQQIVALLHTILGGEGHPGAPGAAHGTPR